MWNRKADLLLRCVYNTEKPSVVPFNMRYEWTYTQQPKVGITMPIVSWPPEELSHKDHSFILAQRGRLGTDSKE